MVTFWGNCLVRNSLDAASGSTAGEDTTHRKTENVKSDIEQCTKGEKNVSGKTGGRMVRLLGEQRVERGGVWLRQRKKKGF